MLNRKGLFSGLVLLAISSGSMASVYDLSAQWNDVINPFGPWSLRKDVAPLFTIVQSDYFGDGSNQRAWADQQYPQLAHVPLWLKLTAPGNPTLAGADAIAGDLMMHGSVFGRTGSVVTSATLTIPENGVAVISGSLFFPFQRGRSMRWDILKNGASITGGNMVGNGTYTRATPFDFGAGSGGVAALTQNVAVGDTLQLRFTSLDDLPDLLTMQYHVAVVPEPTTFVVLGLAGLGLFLRRRK